MASSRRPRPVTSISPASNSLRRSVSALTRLTTEDVKALTDRLGEFEAELMDVTGLGLRELAMNTVAHPHACVPLYGARVAAVPVTSGEGVIGGFCDCVVAILRHLGCDAWVTE